MPGRLQVYCTLTLCSEAVGEDGYCSHFTDEAKASEATCPTHVGKEQSLDGA